tara:strand:- start:860 stop:1735 length:876 start_codon:yes stop_codon:yes gene_type:complete
MINNSRFYCKNKDTYPPFKNGFYMEEFFLNYVFNNNIKTKRKYIPALWSNFQLERWFRNKKNEMQYALDNWVKQNPCHNGYFTITQYDDGPLLQLPENTLKFGACSGDLPLPLIYQDVNNTLESISKKTFKEKQILCSFVGNITSNHVLPNVRQEMFSCLDRNPHFKMINSGGWTPKVNENLQQVFIETTINSKFALAPRGYGRSSFRFFECFQLGTIPIYVWNDICWLPFQDLIDYKKLCIVIHISEIGKLHEILLSVDEKKYNEMFEYYHSIKYLFQLDGMSKHLVENL